MKVTPANKVVGSKVKDQKPQKPTKKTFAEILKAEMNKK